MIVLNLPIRYSYSCANCQKGFDSEEELVLLPYTLPLCCNKCKFKLIYDRLSLYDQNDLIDIYSIWFNEKNAPKERNVLLFKIAKWYGSCIIPNIKVKYKDSTTHSTQKIAHVPTKKDSTTQHNLYRLCYVLSCAILFVGGVNV